MTDPTPNRPPGWRPLFRLPFGARRVETDVDAEIAFHLAMRAERLQARGLATEDAEAVAHRRFGDVAQVRRELIEIDRQIVRQKNLIDYIEDFMNDIAFALRGLRRAPGFATAALLTLALGIGSATAIFSVAYGVLLRPLPFAEPDRIVELSVSLSGTSGGFGSMSAPEYVDLTRGMRSFTAVSAWQPRDRTFGGGGSPERMNVTAATASLFEVLGVRAMAGRTFTASDDVPGAAPVIVLGHDLWARRFGGDPTVIGSRVDVDGIPRTVIGILEPGVRVRSAQAFTPMGLDPARLPGRSAHFLRVMARFRPGVTMEQARAEMAEFATRSSRDFASSYVKGGFTANVRSLRVAWYGDASPMMKALVVTVLLLLLLAAVNVANLLLVRGEARQREMGVRVALGASARRLVRQLLTETFLLSAMGAVIGVPLATIGVRSLLAINPGVVPPGADVSVDVGVLLGVIAVVVVAALVAGVAPALRAGSTDVRTIIALGSAEGGTRGARLRALLVGVEVALATAMLVGAGLVGRSFQRLLAVDAGFDASHALVMSIALPRFGYDSASKVLGFYSRAVERMRALPGVQTAAATASLPLGNATTGWSVAVADRPNAAHELTSPFLVDATTEIFRALGITIVRGRGFGPEDGEHSPPVTVVSEAMVREYWPGQDPIGKRIHPSGRDTTWMTVIGVARDVRPEALSEPPKPMYYVLPPQFTRLTGVADAGMTFVLRTSGDPTTLGSAMRAVIRDLDPKLAPQNLQSLESVVMGSVSRPRFAASVLGSFGVAALLLAVVGVYGVLSYATTRRRREIAVRMALGAHPGSVRRLVITSGLKLAGAGVAAGLLGAVLGARLLTALLYGVSPTDLATLALVAATLLAASAAASWFPARRATRVSLAEVLRSE